MEWAMQDILLEQLMVMVQGSLLSWADAVGQIHSIPVGFHMGEVCGWVDGNICSTWINTFLL